MHFISVVAAAGLALLFFTLRRNKKTTEKVVVEKIQPIKTAFSVDEIQGFVSDKEMFYQMVESKIAEFLQYKFSITIII